MDKYELIRRIEKFAPPETAETWDCSGWLVETDKKEVYKIMLALTVTDNVIRQARENNCDMIISHHPLFSIKLSYSGLDIYCAHTNLDLATGGTTDTLIQNLNFKTAKTDGFLRYVDIKISLNELTHKLKKFSPAMRYTNPKQLTILNRIAFCAGSGSEFIEEAYQNGADALVTGDLKFHTALDSPIAVFDIGHFESEIGVLKVFEKIINRDAKVIYAKEESPFIS